jgi:hypothetical protein
MVPPSEIIMNTRKMLIIDITAFVNVIIQTLINKIEGRKSRDTVPLSRMKFLNYSLAIKEKETK